MKIKFCDIPEPYIAIHFCSQLQLEKLVKYLKAYGYDYGTGNSDIEEIVFLGTQYFSGENYLSLDRSKKHHSNNFISCGKGYKDVFYEFSEIDWNID